MLVYVYLATAIAAEVIATSALKACEQFTRLGPSVVVAVGYFVAFYFLSLTLKTMPVGVVYAMWSGLGIILVSIAGAVWFRQVPDLPAILGMALILIGVVVINTLSKSVLH